MAGAHFRAWLDYWGELDRVVDDAGESRLFGFENVSRARPTPIEIPPEGTNFGFIASGAAVVGDSHGDVRLSAGQWFCMTGGLVIDDLAPATRIMVSQSVGFAGLRAFGGPIEALGRLRYIDGGSDTLLSPPPHFGDPCLNHLHFPSGIDQTEHTHPSVRLGIVAAGTGWCETPDGRIDLVPGVVFAVQTGGRHRFVTEDSTMDAVVYHPDSNWGPTDEVHPMVNRTLVDGRSVDNSRGLHSKAEVAGRRVK